MEMEMENARATLAGSGLALGVLGLILLAVAGQEAWLVLSIVGFGLVLMGTLGGHREETSGRDHDYEPSRAFGPNERDEVTVEPATVVFGSVGPVSKASERPQPTQVAAGEPTAQPAYPPASQPAHPPAPRLPDTAASLPPLPRPEAPTTAELIAEKSRAARGPGTLGARVAGSGGLAGKVRRRLGG